MICHKKEEKLFFPIPRNMHMAIEELLRQNGFKSVESNELNLDSFFKFAIIRSPIDRMLSLYHWKERDSLADGQLKRELSKEGLKAFILEVKNLLNKLPQEEIDSHYWSQTVYLPCKMDKYIKMEDISKQFKKLKIKGKLPRIHYTRNIQAKLKSFLDDEAIEYIKEIYFDDWQLYNLI